MKAITYLFRKTLKNSFKQFIRKPSRLIPVLVVVLMLALVLFSSSLSGPSQYRDASELNAMVFALYLAMFVVGLTKGFKSGASFYSMADVSLMFTAPVKPGKVLFYGLIRQLTSSLLVGVFLLFQAGWLSDVYGVTPMGLIAIFLGYCFVIFCSQVTAMAIYAFSSADDKRKSAVKNAIIAVCVVIAAIALYFAFFRADSTLDGMVSAANSVWLRLVPVAGWMSSAVAGVLQGPAISVLIGILATAAYVGAIIFAIQRGRADYYEDVLMATEAASRAAIAAKEGVMQEAAPRNVKVGKEGIGAGKGASVFFYKQRLESRRVRVFILDATSLIYIAVIAVFSLFMQGQIMAVYLFSAYMLMFTIGTGRWGKELTRPYVYLTPVGPFKKLVYICAETILKCAIESAVLFAVVGVIIAVMQGGLPAQSVGVLLACVFGRWTYGLLFIAGNAFMERVFGVLGSKGLIVLLYILFMFIFAAPGVVTAIMTQIWAGLAVALLLSGVVNIGIAAALGFACRNILNFAELNQR